MTYTQVEDGDLDLIATLVILNPKARDDHDLQGGLGGRPRLGSEDHVYMPLSMQHPEL